MGKEGHLANWCMRKKSKDLKHESKTESDTKKRKNAIIFNTDTTQIEKSKTTYKQH